jgi:hypothetical protein
MPLNSHRRFPTDRKPIYLLDLKTHGTHFMKGIYKYIKICEFSLKFSGLGSITEICDTKDRSSSINIENF